MEPVAGFARLLIAAVGGWLASRWLGGGLTGVSCANASFCVAVDNGGAVYTYNGTSWSGLSAIDVQPSSTSEDACKKR